MSTFEGGRFYNGHVALSRKIGRIVKSSGDPNIFCRDPHLLAIWILILTMANWRDGDTVPKGRKSIIKRGQVLTSLEELAYYSKCSVETARRKLKILRNNEIIDAQSDGRGTLVTINKYSDYQDSNLGDEKQTRNKRETNEKVLKK